MKDRLELLRNARIAGEAAIAQEGTNRNRKNEAFSSLGFILPFMGLVMGYGVLLSKVVQVQPNTGPVKVEMGCENLDGPPSKTLSIRLRKLREDPNSMVLTVFFVNNSGVYSRPSLIYSEPDGFYVEVTGSNGSSVGRNGPRPGGQIAITSTFKGTIEVHSGPVSQLKARESQPLSRLAVDSDACSK